MDENNEMEVPFEPADQHISVRITTKEKKLFIKWCKELRLSKSQGIRKLIVDRLASPEQIQEATDDLTDEIKALKRAISEIKQQLGNKPQTKLNTWAETAERIIEKPDDANAIYADTNMNLENLYIQRWVR
jgi:chromosome segregation ATPase